MPARATPGPGAPFADSWRQGTLFAHEARFREPLGSASGRSSSPGPADPWRVTGTPSGTRFSHDERFHEAGSGHRRAMSPGPAEYDLTSPVDRIDFRRGLGGVGFSSKSSRFGSTTPEDSISKKLGPGSYNAQGEWQWEEAKRMKQRSAAFVDKKTRSRLSFGTIKLKMAKQVAAQDEAKLKSNGSPSQKNAHKNATRGRHRTNSKSRVSPNSKHGSNRGTSSFLSPTRTQTREKTQVRQVVAAFEHEGPLGIRFRKGVTPPVIELVQNTCTTRSLLSAGMELIAMQTPGLEPLWDLESRLRAAQRREQAAETTLRELMDRHADESRPVSAADPGQWAGQDHLPHNSTPLARSKSTPFSENEKIQEFMRSPKIEAEAAARKAQGQKLAEQHAAMRIVEAHQQVEVHVAELRQALFGQQVSHEAADLSALVAVRGMPYETFDALLQAVVSSGVRPLILLFNEPGRTKQESASRARTYFSLQRSISQWRHGDHRVGSGTFGLLGPSSGGAERFTDWKATEAIMCKSPSISRRICEKSLSDFRTSDSKWKEDSRLHMEDLEESSRFRWRV